MIAAIVVYCIGCVLIGWLLIYFGLQHQGSAPYWLIVLPLGVALWPVLIVPSLVATWMDRT